MKRCCRCKIFKENISYGNCKRYDDGLDIMCKDCQHSRYKDHYRTANGLESKKKYVNDNIENSILYKLKTRSKKNDLEFNLTIDDIKIPKFCPILNIELHRNVLRPQDSSPSVDRIDNSKGYIKNNIIITSWKANRIKGTANVNDMKLIYENFFLKNDNIHHENEIFNIKLRKLIFKATKDRSIINNIEHNITINDIKIPNLCPIFKTKLIKSTHGNDPDSASIDRIDNSRGYTVDNIRIVSGKANILKNDSSFEEYEKIFLFYKNLI